MEEQPRPRRPSIKELSKTPSWVMLGFIIGALFVLALPRREPESRPIIVTREPESRPRPAEPPLLTTIEAVFSQWDQYAVWSNDVTQVALWNSAVGDFAEYYEVRRVNDVYYFRTLPQLTHRIIRHGKQPPAECPLRFTETEEQYREWREQDRFERPADDVRVPPRAERPAALPPPSVDVPRGAPALPPSVEPKSGVIPTP